MATRAEGISTNGGANSLYTIFRGWDPTNTDTLSNFTHMKGPTELFMCKFAGPWPNGEPLYSQWRAATRMHRPTDCSETTHMHLIRPCFVLLVTPVQSECRTIVHLNAL